MESLRGINYIWVLLGIVLYFVAVWLRAIRWRFLLSPLKKVSPHRLFLPLVVGFAISNIIPGRVGFLAKAYLLGERERISKIAGGGTIVADQICEGITIFFLGLVALLFIPLASEIKRFIYLILLLYGFASILLFFTASSPNRLHRLTQPLLRLLPHPFLRQRIERWLELFFSGLASLRSLPYTFFTFLFSLAVFLAEAGVFYLIALSFNLHLPFYIFVLAVVITNLSLLIPSLPGGIGPFEFFGKQTILLFGVKEVIATTYIAFLHLTILLPITALGLFLMWWQGLGFKG